MPIVLTTREKHWERPLEQVDRPLAGSPLIAPECMSELMQVGDDAQLALQGDRVGAGAVRAAAAVAAVQSPEGQRGGLAEKGAKIPMERLELELPLVQRSPVGLRSLEPLDGGENAGSEFHRGVKDFADAGWVIGAVWHGLWFLSLISEQVAGLPEIGADRVAQCGLLASPDSD